MTIVHKMSKTAALKLASNAYSMPYKYGEGRFACRFTYNGPYMQHDISGPRSSYSSYTYQRAIQDRKENTVVTALYLLGYSDNDVWAIEYSLHYAEGTARELLNVALDKLNQ